MAINAMASSTRNAGVDTIFNQADLTKLLTFNLSGQTASTTLTVATAQTTSQTLNIPNITGADTVATLGLAQTFSGAKTFSSAPTFSTLTTAGVLLNSAAGLVSSSAGPLAIANGGTNNASLAVTAGGTLYTDGTKVVNVGAGTSGQFLKSNGASAPTWASPTVNFAQEIPTGTVNGSNTSFTLAHTPASTASVEIRLDGIVLLQTTDYTQSGATITFVTAPSTGQVVSAYYTF